MRVVAAPALPAAEPPSTGPPSISVVDDHERAVWRDVPYPLVLVALATAYFLAGKLGLMLAFVHKSATTVWPPTGIALAAMLLLGYRVWPGIFLGAFLVNVTTAGSAATSLGIAMG